MLERPREREREREGGLALENEREREKCARETGERPARLACVDCRAPR